MSSNPIKTLWKDGKELSVAAAKGFVSHWKLVGGLFLLVVAGALTIHLWDAELLKKIRIEKDLLNSLARGLSYWGDYTPGTLGLALALWLIGFILKKRRWQRVAIAVLLAASFSGIFVNIFKFSLGRPRPEANIKDGLYGFHMNNNAYRSLPSGHSTTAAATAGALIVSMPVLAIPITGAAVGVCWSRLYLNRHYPSDVLHGIFMGGTFGVFFGLAVARLSKK